MANVSMDEIKKLVCLQLGVRDIHDDSLFLEDLGAESADVANIIAVLEEKYQIAFKESEIAKVRTPADLSNLVNAKLSS